MDEEIISKQKAARAEIRKLHDTLKTHPYFTSFDMKYARYCFGIFREMYNAFIDGGFREITEDAERNMTFYSNPQATLICPFFHDFCAHFVAVLNGDSIDRHIMSIQGYLHLFHEFIDNYNTAILTASGRKGGSFTKEAVWDKEKNMGWHAVQHVTQEKREKLIAELKEKIGNLSDDKLHDTVLRQSLERTLKDLENNEGRYYLLVDD